MYESNRTVAEAARAIQYVCSGLRGCVLLLVAFAVTVTHADECSYAYDTAGRLTAVYCSNGRSITYSYDKAGNLSRRTVTVIADTDDDGMDDDWELAHFTTLDRDGTEDFDHDGVIDLHEFLAGTLPKQADSVLRMVASPDPDSGGTRIEWDAVPGKYYRVQFRDSMAEGTWTDLSGDLLATGSTASKLDPTGASAAMRFYRILLLP